MLSNRALPNKQGFVHLTPYSIVKLYFMATTSDIKKGVILKFKNEPWLVIEFQHVKPGKGGAFVRTKLKNIRDGKVVDNTFKTGETIEIEELERKKMKFLYTEGNNYYFMDPETYDQVSLPVEVIGDKAKFLKEDLDVDVVYHEGNPLTAELPIKIKYKVIEAPPAVKGDTASGSVTKTVVLENGLKLPVPIFIKEGDEIIVNTEKGEYVERA
jgi:elongation factor P